MPAASKAPLSQLIDALRAEQRSRYEARANRQRAAEALRDLIRSGAEYFKIAGHVARAMGLPRSVSDDERLAARLRKLVSRVTSSHAIRPPLAPSAGAEQPLSVPCSGTSTEVHAMSIGKLVKRITVTEEFNPEEPAPVEGLNDSDHALEGADSANEGIENEDLGDAEVTAKPAKSPRALSGTRPRSSKC